MEEQVQEASDLHMKKAQIESDADSKLAAQEKMAEEVRQSIHPFSTRTIVPMCHPHAQRALFDDR